MIYIGIGNAGCRILWEFHRLLYGDGAPAAPRHVNYFVFGDADLNNSVLFDIKDQGLDNVPEPHGVRIMGLDSFWSGGCGVYHIIGEVLADKAEGEQVLEEALKAIPATQPATIVFSVGGGTGGGVADYLSEYLVQKGRHVRMVGVLPELDHPDTYDTDDEKSLRINGSDDFQCASAGRFLVKYMNSTMRAGTHPNERDLITISNSALANIPERVRLNDAVKRLNHYISHALMLIETIVATYTPEQRMITVGIGTGRRADSTNPLETLTKELIRTALSPLDLQRPLPTGLSALPVPIRFYKRALNLHLSAKGDEETKEARILRQVLGKCQGVSAWLFCRSEQVQREIQTGGASLDNAVREELERVFGPNVPVDVSLRVGTRYPDDHFPDDENNKSDVVLLLSLKNLIVEDIYRLAMFFAESSFAWKEAGVGDVARHIRTLLTRDRPEFRTADSDRVKLSLLMEKEITTGNPTIEGRERHPIRFWGNIADLKDKVLQVLQKNEKDFTDRLLRPADVGGALAFLRNQIWYYEE